jgi:2-methylisocitrate lyase-like PEP mutase family enzyme
MTPSPLRAKAELLRRLHQGPRALLLPNVWDVASARIIEDAGFPALATTSAGIANSLGYPDGQHIGRTAMLEVVGRIVAAVQVPVTADLEAGYGQTPQQIAETVAELLESGAVGLNLEDSLEETSLVAAEEHAAKVKAVREAGKAAGVDIVINARTDVYLAQVGPPESRFDETLRRARLYRQAGADCIFVPGLRDGNTIGRLVKELNCPVNILAGPGFPPIAELEKLGVARVSFGSSPHRATLGLLRRMAQEIREQGTYSALEGMVSYAEANALFRPRGK